jgi:hypothetical protein
MQHDTSVYKIKLAGKLVQVVASLLYLRFSKRRYLRFYRTFKRFRMKCFFHEGLMFWGYAAPVCIIDNTNLARLRGTGKEAVIAPEMAEFSRSYGFRFCCHEKGHANRKAGEERGFQTVETNFFPGRRFQDLEDLNRQAIEWATVRMERRRQGKTRVIPFQAFEAERAFLVKLPRHLPAPYWPHSRVTDQYGYVRFAGNFYWVPDTKSLEVVVLEYADRLRICSGREALAEYRLPGERVKNHWFSPAGLPAPRHQPRNRKQPADEEEKRLRAMGQPVGAYLDFALKAEVFYRHQFVRKLLALSKQITPALFSRTLERALQYRIVSVETIRRIAALCATQGTHVLPSAEVDESFREREAYREGCLTDAPDLSRYDSMFDENDEEEHGHG